MTNMAMKMIEVDRMADLHAAAVDVRPDVEGDLYVLADGSAVRIGPLPGQVAAVTAAELAATAATIAAMRRLGPDADPLYWDADWSRTFAGALQSAVEVVPGATGDLYRFADGSGVEVTPTGAAVLADVEAR